MVIVDAGEIGVHTDSRCIVLRPSLGAMARLGTPKEIVDTFISVMAPPEPQEGSSEQLNDALAVLFVCSDEDLSDVFGYWSETGYVPGSADRSHIVPLARCLLKHGVVGALPPLPRKASEEPKYVKEFDARAHVSLAMAHLGLSERDAWNMTMTALVGALRAKFPQSQSHEPGAKAPTKEEHDATMEWFERIEAARRLKQGVH